MSESYDRVDGEDLMEQVTELVELWLCKSCAKGEGPSSGNVGKEGLCSGCDMQAMLKLYIL